MNILRKTAIAASIYLIGTATFAGSVNASVNVFGASQALTVNATVTPTNDFVSNNSKLYLAIVQGADVYFYSDTAGFVPYAGGLSALTGPNPAEAPPVRSITKGAESITLTGDARGVAGADVYVGYGASFTELISNARYTKLYTMITRPEDLTMACVTSRSQIIGPWDASFINKSVSPNYTGSNNVFNTDGLTGWQECFGSSIASDASNVTARWTWDYSAIPLEPKWPKAYPAVLYGRYPGTVDISPNMPTQIGTTQSIVANWDTTVSTTGTLNLSFDVWISSDGKSSVLIDPKTTIHTELMVWVGTWGKYTQWDSWFPFEVVTVNGRQYHLFLNKNYQNQQLATFIDVSPQLKGTSDLMGFANLLKERNLLKATDYIESVELGTEIGDGIGEVKINNFSVTVR